MYIVDSIKKHIKNIILILIAIILLILAILLSNISPKTISINNVSLSQVDILDSTSNDVTISIIPSKEEEMCAISKEKDPNNLIYMYLDDNKCQVIIEKEKYYIYFKDKEGILSSPLELNNYVIKNNFKDKYYLAINDKISLKDKIDYIGKDNLSYEFDKNILALEKENIIAKKPGKTVFKILLSNKEIKTIDIVVSNVIIERPKTFNEKKQKLTCQAFTEDEAKLLDEILEYRVAEVGYGTRAGAVEAARFLTLEFPYKISYFYENGRLSNTGVNHADGEGRWYHKGLYLSESKYKDLVYHFSKKPAMWGCGLTNWEPEQPKYPYGAKLPNGLDCSGFVSWALFNGGTDIGDIGAEKIAASGKYTKLTPELAKSNKIKVGDLFNFWGHISIIIGIDDNNYYVAESLNTYYGVVVKTYSKSKVSKIFKYVSFMDDVYESEGNITNMWY